MALEPDNLVLTLLREIRATLAEHSTLLVAHSAQLADIDKKFDDQKYLMTQHIWCCRDGERAERAGRNES
jgi:hypothetical protein